MQNMCLGQNATCVNCVTTVCERARERIGSQGHDVPEDMPVKGAAGGGGWGGVYGERAREICSVRLRDLISKTKNYITKCFKVTYYYIFF